MANPLLDWLEEEDKKLSSDSNVEKEKQPHPEEISQTTVQSKPNIKIKKQTSPINGKQDKTAENIINSINNSLNNKLDKQKEAIPINEEKIVESISTQPKEVDIQKLLKDTETYFPEEWLEYYESAKRSKKNTWQRRKILAGKFRINKDHKKEFLPEDDCSGSAQHLLARKWKITD